jgi:DNA-binding beta-propeller fold protein YncE
VRLARDGLLYVCDRANNRIQVFRTDGTFVTEFVVAPATRGNGSVWDLDVSHDAPQAWLYNADGENNHVWTLVRASGKVVGRRATSTRPRWTPASAPRSSSSGASASSRSSPAG